jgi:hypothetical protein
VEAIGLGCLGLGLSFLKLAPQNPGLRPLAYASFVVTALSIAIVLLRMYWGS